jgi:hypothetical protein
MIEELDNVVLTRDLAEHGLGAGDIGTVVLVHRGHSGYEVEFTALDGETIAVVTLMAGQFAPREPEKSRTYASGRLREADSVARHCSRFGRRAESPGVPVQGASLA